MTPREAAITLNLIPGLGPVRVMRLMQVFVSPELVLEAPASMLMDIPGIGAQLARHISSWRSIVNPYRELELADKAGATVTTVFDASYPAARADGRAHRPLFLGILDRGGFRTLHRRRRFTHGHPLRQAMRQNRLS